MLLEYILTAVVLLCGPVGVSSPEVDACQEAFLTCIDKNTGAAQLPRKLREEVLECVANQIISGSVILGPAGGD